MSFPLLKRKTTHITLVILILSASMLLTGCGSSKRLLPSCEPDPPEPFAVPEKIRVALVLGSGGVRGMAHVGVIEELMDACVPIDLIVGCSAGSIVGAVYADNPDLDALKCAIWKIKTDSVLDIDLWNCKYGLSKGNCLHRVLDEHLVAETFDELKIPLVVVASDLNTGELVPIGSGDLVTAVQASCSIPFVFVPCKYRGRVLVDGGVVNPVPVKVARDLGAEIVIAVDLSELLPKTFPTNLFQVATRSAEIAFMWQNEVCTRGADIVIRPRTTGIGTFNEKMKWELYCAGKSAAEEKRGEIIELLRRNEVFSTPVNCKTRCVALPPYLPKICLEGS
ncbi:patatin-like phospholipase family protein [Estrella lausannensis]|uniref:Patatin-like phospholipase n=1 Tax=Estrella lausannensis TaxID=483423 RepID=A0A0H5E863_9BACT|nr:patatin-like phospholipase family protein [Estrella lausannensis]CRX39540.1 Patatin-like phospholipase [Estrella lausannensis]